MVSSAPQLLTEFALRHVRRLADGNGVDPLDITVIESVEDNYILPAVMILTPHVTQDEKRIKGKPLERPNYNLDDRDELLSLAQTIRQDNERIQNMLQMAAEKLRDKDSFGWAFEEENLSLPELDTVLCKTEPCNDCQGAGEQNCSACKGQKNITCSACRGNGNQQCPQCNGSGKELGAAGDTQICNMCQGRTTIQCRICQGKCIVPCPRCHASGTSQCTGCDGTGFISFVFTVRFSALLRFQTNPAAYENLPSYITEAVQKLGLAKFKNNLADIVISEKTFDQKALLLHYQAAFPFAKIILKLADQKIPFCVIGKKPTTLQIPPFLDRVLEPALNDLKIAAQGHSVLSHINKAFEFRAIQSTTQTAKNASELCKQYQNAVSPKMAQDIYRLLHLSIAQLSKLPRFAIGGAGMILSAIYFSLYFFSIRRNPWPFRSNDIFPLIIMLIIQFIAVKLGSEWGLRFVFKRAQATTLLKSKRLAVPFGWIGAATLAGVIFIYVILVVVASAKGLFSITQ